MNLEPDKEVMEKSSSIDHPVLDLIKKRKSVRAFSSEPIEADKINSLFEATRWAPSSSNEQPWVYIYATRDQTELWSKLLDPLNDSNKIWVKDAPLLILSLARKTFSRFGSANAHALYDLGGANSFLSLQAVELGLQVRQMAGFNVEKTILNLNIPDTYEVGVFIAVGYPGDPANLPDQLKQREAAPRERFLQQEFVMNRTF
ncbi:MAG TPA: nitroreductase family protein [Ohtaekwangia sp.]|uniref:nitroreductase family protein n=1 Tax=Ohtaekwangia sp. TaxID=2066019 RepID=UPI002F9569AE